MWWYQGKGKWMGCQNCFLAYVKEEITHVMNKKWCRCPTFLQPTSSSYYFSTVYCGICLNRWFLFYADFLFQNASMKLHVQKKNISFIQGTETKAWCLLMTCQAAEKQAIKLHCGCPVNSHGVKVTTSFWPYICRNQRICHQTKILDT